MKRTLLNSLVPWTSVALTAAPLTAAPPALVSGPSQAAELPIEWMPTLDGTGLALRRLGFGADGTLYVLRGSRALGFDLQAIAPGCLPSGRVRGGTSGTDILYGTALGAPTRTFSIDHVSPTVGVFFAGLHRADDLLTVPPAEAGATAEDVGGNGPWVSLPGEAFPRHAIGFAPTLDVDGLSRNHGTIVPPAGSAWRILFSVRRGSSGDAGTGVEDQDALGQQAGDLFESRQVYAPVLPVGAEAHGADVGNDLAINQDELLLVPSVGSDVFVAAQLDELDAWDDIQLVSETSGALAERIYYTVKWESDPDWAMTVFTLPAGWDVGDAPPLPELAPVYASRFDLGLTSNDDIDGLVVFDADGDGAFTNGDAILLSLREGSTSLGPGFLYREGPGGAFAGTGSSSDVFCVYREGATFLSRLATELQLGLSITPADIDALEVRSALIVLDAWPLVRPFAGPILPRQLVLH
jgi:hypothetical protein